MVVTIKLFASFQEGRFAADKREVPPGTRLVSVVDELRIPRETIGVVMVNNRHADLERELSAGDVVSLFPLLGGG